MYNTDLFHFDKLCCGGGQFVKVQNSGLWQKTSKPGGVGRLWTLWQGSEAVNMSENTMSKNVVNRFS